MLSSVMKLYMYYKQTFECECSQIDRKIFSIDSSSKSEWYSENTYTSFLLAHQFVLYRHSTARKMRQRFLPMDSKILILFKLLCPRRVNQNNEHFISLRVTAHSKHLIGDHESVHAHRCNCSQNTMWHLTPSTSTTLRALLDEGDDDIDLLAIALIFCPTDVPFIFKLVVGFQTNTGLQIVVRYRGAVLLVISSAVKV